MGDIRNVDMHFETGRRERGASCGHGNGEIRVVIARRANKV